MPPTNVPSYRGLMDYPGLLMRSNQSYDDARNALISQHEQNMMSGVDDSLSFPSTLSDIQANKMNPWSPFYQRLQEQGINHIRMADYNPKAAAAQDAAMQGTRLAEASRAMPQDLPLGSVPASVRSLYGDEGTRLLQRGRF